MTLLICAVFAWLYLLVNRDDSRGSHAEAKRVRERMKLYQDEWERNKPPTDVSTGTQAPHGEEHQ